MVALVLAIGAARADDSTIASPADVPAIRLDGSAVRLDGIADEEVWRQAAEIHGLTSFDPAGGEPAASQLQAWVFYDASALYIAARVTTPPGSMRGRLAAREQLNNDDVLEVMIDAFLDRRTGYAFTVNPYGVQQDLTIDDDDWNPTWDGVWDAATQRYEDGFSAELRIPFRTLRFAAAPTQRWGFGLGVFSGVRQQYDKWPPMKRDRGSVIAQLGTLTGLADLPSSHNLDLIPTLTTSYGGSNTGSGFRWDRPVAARARDPGIVDLGLDAAWAVTSATTLNATVNPDFSQVEADADQLTYNLRFPLLLQEKRPFFLENVGVFTTPVSLLYTRSVVDPIAGIKLSGRLGAWSVGVLSTWDQLPLASRLVEPHRPSGFEDLTGKDAIDTVARVALDLDAGARVGLWLADKTLYDRSARSLGARNDVASADASFTAAGIYLLRAQLGGSYIDGISVPGGGFTGGFYSLNARRHDANLIVDLRTEYYANEFRAETSPLTRVGIRPSSAEVTYRHYTGTGAVPYIEADIQLSAVHDADELKLLDGAIRPSLLAHIGKNADLSVFYSRGRETFVRRFTAIDTAGAQLTAYPSSLLSFTAKLQGGDQINYDTSDVFLGRTVLADVHTTVTPTHNLELDLGFTRSVLRRPGGELAADVDIYYAKVALSVTTRLSARVISQLDDGIDVLRNSALLAYVIYPGTEAYLGYEEGDGGLAAGLAHALDRRVFFKCSYRWQL
jgi:hypothetical protein